MLERVLRLVCPPMPDNSMDSDAPGLPNPVAARDQLRQAHAVQDQAQQRLQEASAAVGRVRDLIEAAETANAHAKATAEDLAAATKAWAEGGALGEPNDGRQLAAARESAQAAYLARTRAAGAEDGLESCERREREARYEIERADSAVLTAAMAVTELEEWETMLRRLEQASAEFQAAREAMEPLRLLTHPKWASGHTFGPYKASRFVQRLRAADVHPLTDEQFLNRMIGKNPLGANSDDVAATWAAAKAWADLVQRLCKDPDATLSDSIEDAT